MKLFRTEQIAAIDRYTTEHEPIDPIDLMERAAASVAAYVVKETLWEGNIHVFCGPGNNGGDGLAVARLLASHADRFRVMLWLLDFGKELTGSAAINFQRLSEQGLVRVMQLKSQNDLPKIRANEYVIDALFGSGLNRPLDGLPAEIVQHINHSGAEVLSIDIPSGLMGEDNAHNIPENIIKASLTLTFQFPKLSFLFPENEVYTGTWHVNDIGLHQVAIESTFSPFHYMEKTLPGSLLKNRSKFAHKGSFGHALLISGAYGKMGAAVLASRACLRAGVGLLTSHVPHGGYPIIQTAVPEAMTSIDESDIMFTGAAVGHEYQAVGCGPGIGQKVNTQRGLKKLIEEVNCPLLLDADALNILGTNRDWLKLLPSDSILTPHPKEFERLTGPVESAWERLQAAISFAQRYNVIVVLKGAYTQVIDSDGEVWFNSSGNPGMATAGSGDVLSGIVLALLAQGYKPFDAARLGVYVHGVAGDVAAETRGYEALIASDLIESLGEAFRSLY